MNKQNILRAVALQKPTTGTLVLATICSMIMAGCGSDDGMPTAREVPASEGTLPALVLAPATAARQLTFTGELLPYERTDVYAMVPCYIQKVLVDIGQQVQGGQVLAIAEAPEMQARYAQAVADVQAAQARLLGSADALARLQEAARTPGAVAAGDLERLRSQLLADSGQLAAAKAGQQAQANLKGYLTIKAPFAGIITRRLVDAGALVGTLQAQPLFALENNRKLRLHLPIPEAYTATGTDGLAIQFAVDAWPGQFFAARLARKAGTIDLQSRTETWEYEVDNRAGKLKAGMYLTTTLHLQRSGEAFIVPATTIATTLQKKFVVAMRQGRAVWVDVRQGMATPDGIEVYGQLLQGDTLLLRGNDEVKEGTPLKVQVER